MLALEIDCLDEEQTMEFMIVAQIKILTSEYIEVIDFCYKHIKLSILFELIINKIEILETGEL